MASLFIPSCAPAASNNQIQLLPQGSAIPTSTPAPTPLPTRPNYAPGQLVNYTAQTGDTLPAMAVHFNTTVDEILAANPIVPQDVTTMPPGLPMKIPIYYLPLWGSPYQILPDNAFVNGPALIGFDTSAFVVSQPGWLKDYHAYAGSANRTGAQIVDYVASNFSISPRLLLALLEYQAGALSQAKPSSNSYVLGYQERFHNSLYLQLIWAANTLNNGYYGWRTGHLTSFDLPDGSMIRPDPWQNAASVALQYYFAHVYSGTKFKTAISHDGLIQTYQRLFGDPWADQSELIPGSLQQPPLEFPFRPGHTWTYTGGPHTGWGNGEPLAAVDFAPPSEHHGCFTVDPQEYVIAMADGVIVRSETGTVVLDLDGDGNERTGWDILYLHIGTAQRAPIGKVVKAGDLIGYPSCEGGETTGTHVHIVRKYNGEWIPADGPLAFDFEGWITHNGPSAYLGTLTKGNLTVTACECSDFYSQIQAPEQIP
jgi:LasA protease